MQAKWHLFTLIIPLLLVACGDNSKLAAPSTDTTGAAVTETVLGTSISGTPPAVTNATGLTFAFAASEATLFECRLDGGEWIACDNNFSTGKLADGEHTLEVRAKDEDGLVDSQPVSWIWTVDTKAPVVTIEQSPESLSNAASFVISFSADEEAMFYCVVNSTAAAVCTSPLTLNDLGDGMHKVTIQARDVVGNTGSSQTVSWTVDRQAPNTFVAGAPAQPVSTSTIQLILTADEPGIFECAVDGGTWQACLSPLNMTAADGNHSLLVRAQDAAGNMDATPAVVNWDIDTTGPEIVITPVSALPTDTPVVTFAFVTGDGTNIRCNFDNGSWFPCSSPVTDYTMDPGSHSLAVKARDMPGNWGSMTFGWRYEIPPVVSIGLDASVSSSANVPFALWDAPGIPGNGHAECSVDGSPYTLCTSPFIDNGLADNATHSLAISSFTPGGFFSDEPALLEWNVDANRVWQDLITDMGAACGLQTDGSLWCWGNVGPPLTNISAIPKPVGPAPDLVTVATYASLRCGINSVGDLWCQGNNYYRRLGDAAIATTDTNPHQVLAGTKWKDVAIGSRHVCALQADNTPWCWGWNNTYQLGKGAGPNVYTPMQVTTDTYIAIVASAASNCGIQSDNSLWCWGDSNQYPTAISAGASWQSVSMGFDHTCGIRSDQSLWCWGSNAYGQLGMGDLLTRSSPEPVSAGSKWLQVAAGRDITCAIADNNALWCWGQNNKHQLGLADSNNRLVPVSVFSGRQFVDVGVAPAFACALDTGGTLGCWGSSFSSQSYVRHPKPVTWPTGWRSVSLGQDSGCALQNDGQVQCWGKNSSGEAGQTDPALVLRPQPVSAGTFFASLAGAYGTSCAIRANDASLWCWGYNGYGNVGNGANTSQFGPTAVSPGTQWSMTAHSPWHGCGLHTDGSLWCWGNNSNGQLGIGHTTNANVPQPVSAGIVWKQVAAGDGHSCGIRSDDSLWCWGSNANGKLGINSTIDQWLPVPVSSGETFAMVVTQKYHTCALTTDARLFCWGKNGNGEIGDGSQTDRWVPVEPLPKTRWSTVTTGYFHTCASSPNGQIYCWGGNGNDGRLGDGSTTPKLTPVPVEPADKPLRSTRLSAAYYTTCAINDSDDQLFCWGTGYNAEIPVFKLVTPDFTDIDGR